MLDAQVVAFAGVAVAVAVGALLSARLVRAVLGPVDELRRLLAEWSRVGSLR